MFVSLKVEVEKINTATNTGHKHHQDKQKPAQAAI